MLIRDFGKLPVCMRTPEVRAYYDMLAEKRSALLCKRMFDVFLSLLLLVLLAPAMLVIALLIIFDSKGPPFFRQPRLTGNMREFHILKFRTMVKDADKTGSLLTVEGDERVTRIGRKLRPLHLDEMPQLINVLKGDMSFVGTRPEVERYIGCYTEEMFATFLLPGGLTSMASILYRDEGRLMKNAADADSVYIEEILPQKMQHNLEYLRDYAFIHDIKIILGTLFNRRGRRISNG